MAQDRENFKEDSKGGRPQYGKKGWKPKNPNVYSKFNLDDLKTNDPVYWNRVKQFDNVSKFTWPLIIGRNLEFSNLIPSGDYHPADGVDDKVHIPQIMKIDYVPGPGWAESTGDGINRTLSQIMSRLRSSLSTSNIGFEVADLGLFMASTASIPMLAAIAKRALRTRKMWKDKNYIVPRTMIKAMGFDYQDIADNVQYYTAKLNAVIDEYNGMNIPDFSYIYDRQYTFCNNIFADEDSDLAQFYLFMPTHYYKYFDKESGARAMELQAEIDKFKEAYSLESRFEALLMILEDTVRAWKLSGDLFQINGVLLRAMKDIPRQVLPHVEIDEVQSYVVDRAITMQIMNCTILGDAELADFDITQDRADPTYVMWKPKVTNTSASGTAVLLRVFEDDLSQDDNMEMTRLTNMVGQEGTFHAGMLYRCGDMLVTKVSMYTSGVNPEDDMEVYEFTSNHLIINEDEVTNGGAPLLVTFKKILSAIKISNFRYMPAIHVWTSAGSSISYEALLGDVYQYEIYHYNDFIKLQDAAFQSIWLPKSNIL